MRDAVDTRNIIEDMRVRGYSGVMSVKDIMEYTGKSHSYVRARFGVVGKGGLSMITVARVLGRLGAHV